MNEKPTRVLLIEDNPGDVRLIREMLHEAEGAAFEMETADRIARGLERLARGGIDVILLDLHLPDSRGFPTLKNVQAGAPDIPILVLTGLEDEDLAVNAVREGAQDYLVKGQIDTALLVRCLRYALERHRLRSALRMASLTDELTGLFNRRGFLLQAEHQLKIACRLHQPMTLHIIDLEALKLVNDMHGAKEGDHAIEDVATALREASGEGDLLARIAGDEFAGLIFDAGDCPPEPFPARLRACLKGVNRAAGRPFQPAIRMAAAQFDPRSKSEITVESLLAGADAQLYEHKRGAPASESLGQDS